MRKEKVQLVKRTATLVLLAVLVCCIHIKADIWPLVLTGDAIPGTANFRFTSVSQAVVNSSGTVAFDASFVNPATGGTGHGTFKIAGGQLTSVALEGQPLPDAPGSYFGASGNPSINDAGDVVFFTYTSEFPGRTFEAIFEQSSGALRRVVDLNTPVPNTAVGQSFGGFSAPQINNRGDIAFGATLAGSGADSGLFLVSQGLQALALNQQGAATTVNTSSFWLNNRGDVLVETGNIPGAALGVISGGVLKPAISFPQNVPNTSFTTDRTEWPGINDDGDIVYASESIVPTGRGSALVQNAIVRQQNGSLQKIAAAGDPVPGSNGGVFQSVFSQAHVNQSAITFVSQMTQPNAGPAGVIIRVQDGAVNVLASEKQYVDGIGTLDFIGEPNFDTQQGSLVTFVANAAGGSETGIYAATAAPAYTIRFPHIADGGGWRTTFTLANRSATAANATISFYSDNGAPLLLSVGGTPQSQVSVAVPALGVAQVQTQGAGPLTTGWALVQSDQNLSGIAIYSLLDGSGTATTEVGAPASLALSSMSVFAQNGSATATGIALANPNGTAANVTLTLKDSYSTQLAQTSITIPAMGHIARYANELFPGIPPGEFTGKIEVLSTQPLAGLTLRQRGAIFTSLPVIP